MRPSIFLLALALFANAILCQGSPSSDGKIKNFLYIISDDLKTSSLGCYGNEFCKTPNLDRLAKASMRFTRAYCQGTVCRPSRISIMSSRYLDKKAGQHITFPQHFKKQGWYSARVSKIFHMPIPGAIVRGDSGTDHPESWSEFYNFKAKEAHTDGAYACLNKNIFTTGMEGRETTGEPNRMFVSVKMTGDGSDQPDPMAANQAIELLRKHKDSPFLLAVGFVRPHYPMVTPEKYFTLYPHKKMKMPETRQGDWDDIPKAGISRSNSKSTGLDQYPENQKRMLSAYYASVSFMDTQLGKLMAELDRLGLRESTAIVFTSDHGYHLGDHEFWQKANLHEEVTNVPLMISVPGFKPGISSSLVELADIFPTFTELAGIDTPESCHGLSLVPILKDPSHSIRKYAFSYDKKNHSLRSDQWAYISYGKAGADGEELYDMEKDRKQFTNLAKNPKYQEILEEHRQALKNKLAAIR